MHSARHRDVPWPAYLVWLFLGYCAHHKLSVHSFGLQGHEAAQTVTQIPLPCSGLPPFKRRALNIVARPGRRSSLLRTCVEYLCTHRLAWLLLPLAAASPLAAGPFAFCLG